MKIATLEESIFKLHNRDARDIEVILKTYHRTSKFVDVTITSPPYHNLKSYGFTNQIGYGQKYSEYIKDIIKIFNQIYDITKDSGSLWIIVDTFTKDGVLINLPFEISEKLKPKQGEKGWILTDIIIWKKNKTLPWSRKGQLRNLFEYILFFTKSKEYKFYHDKVRIFNPTELKEWWVKFPERYNPKGAVPSNVWEFPIPPQGKWGGKSLRHFNPLPRKMIENILYLTTDPGDVVFDPFAGSGTVLAVADFLNRKWFGFEMNHQYCEMFENHIMSEVRKELLIENKRKFEFDTLREQFEDSIKKLRLIKFPRTLTKELAKRSHLIPEGNRINTVFAFSGNLEDSKFFSLSDNKLIAEVYILLNNPIDCFDINNEIHKILITPPLSLFQIDSHVSILLKTEFIKSKATFLNNLELWLYTKSVNKYKKQISYSEWLIESSLPEWEVYVNNSSPPIISDIKVDQKVVKTWKSKEEQIRIAKELFNYIIEGRK